MAYRIEAIRELARLYLQLQRTALGRCDQSSATQCWIVTELARGGPLSLAELGRRLQLDKGWLSRAIDGMAAEGLVRKEASDEDQRKLLLSLTTKGEARHRQLSDELDAQAKRVMKRITPARRAEVQTALGELLEAVRGELEQEQ